MPARSPKKSKAAAKPKAAKRTPARNGKAAKRPARPSNAVKAARAAPAAPAIQYRNVTPLLVIDGASDAIAWYKKAFGAKELTRQPLPDGKLMHAAIQIGDSILMLSDAFGPAPQQMMGVTLHIQSPDIETYWSRAVAGGASVVMPLANQFWGDRYGQLRDPFGHNWSLGWPVKMTQAERDRKQAEAMAQFSGGWTPGANA
jgi:uncharacterized glyoxalase superfamily protein PhnB